MPSMPDITSQAKSLHFVGFFYFVGKCIFETLFNRLGRVVEVGGTPRVLFYWHQVN